MKNVVITILVVLVLGLGGYLVYDKVIDKEEVKPEIPNKADLIGINLESETVKTLYNNLQFTDIQKILSLDKIDNFSVNNISDEQIFKIVLDKVEKTEIALTNEEVAGCLVGHYSYLENNFTNIIKKIFGEKRADDISFNVLMANNYKINAFRVFTYNTNTKTIDEYAYGCGGFASEGWSIDTKAELKDAKKDDSNIYLYESVEQKRYKDEKLQETINKTLKYTYVLENNNYRFEKLEVVK